MRLADPVVHESEHFVQCLVTDEVLGGWLDFPDDMRSQDPPSFPHVVVKTGLPHSLSRLWDRDLDGNPWTAAER
jgi:hypothetical protein